MPDRNKESAEKFGALSKQNDNYPLVPGVDVSAL